MKTKLPFGACAAFALAMTTADAQVTLTSQMRRVRAVAHIDDLVNFDSDAEVDWAPGFGPFSSPVAATASIVGGDTTVGGFQDSTISTSAFRAEGSTFGSSNITGDLVLADATSASIYEVQFSVANPVAYDFVGALSASDSGSVSVSVRTAAGDFLFGAAAITNEQADVDLFGTLPSGDYVYLIRAFSSIYATAFSPDFSFSDYCLSFELRDELGTRFCSAVPNSTGMAGRMSVSGSAVVADDHLILQATDLPTVSNNGYFLMGTGMGMTVPPGSAGPICLAGNILRIFPPLLDTADLPGGFQLEAGTGGPITGAITAGSTWNFQAWHRDASAGASNFTDAVSVTFL
ncbi:MAG: hypothetical protein GY711_08140 [bacterium]|nr:hypothetical protein [bacterium]